MEKQQDRLIERTVRRQNFSLEVCMEILTCDAAGWQWNQLKEQNSSVLSGCMVHFLALLVLLRRNPALPGQFPQF
jgi:hypothetical protein